MFSSVTTTGIQTDWVTTSDLHVAETQLPDGPGNRVGTRPAVVYTLDKPVTVHTASGDVVLPANAALTVAGHASVSGAGRVLVIRAPSGVFDTLPDLGVCRADLTNHYRWGDGCDGWRLVETDMLSVREERMPPGTAEQAHLHRWARQLFYVLEGTCVMATPRRKRTVASGMGVVIDPGVPHQFRNPGPDGAHFLVISGPTTVGDRSPVADLRARPRKTGRP